MKFDQDLCLNLWYELDPRVRCAFGNVSFLAPFFRRPPSPARPLLPQKQFKWLSGGLDDINNPHDNWWSISLICLITDDIWWSSGLDDINRLAARASQDANSVHHNTLNPQDIYQVIVFLCYWRDGVQKFELVCKSIYFSSNRFHHTIVKADICPTCNKQKATFDWFSLPWGSWEFLSEGKWNCRKIFFLKQVNVMSHWS